MDKEIMKAKALEAAIAWDQWLKTLSKEEADKIFLDVELYRKSFDEFKKKYEGKGK